MSRDNIPGRYAMAEIIDDALEKAPQGAVWVEVGVALGKGVSYMARKLIDARRKDVRLYAVDPWGGYARNGEQQAMVSPTKDWSLFVQMMKENAPEEFDRIHILRTDSVQAASIFRDHTIDLVILDADHTFDAVMSDLKAWLPKLKPHTGIIGGDDHEIDEFPGVVQACHWYFGEGYEAWKDPKYQWGVWRKRLSENFDTVEGEGGEVFRGDPTP